MSKKVRTALHLKIQSESDRVFILQCLQNKVVTPKQAKRLLLVETVV